MIKKYVKTKQYVKPIYCETLVEYDVNKNNVNAIAEPIKINT